jgi:phosphomannomutase
LKEVFPGHMDSLAIDGIRLKAGDGWVLIRASRIEALVRLTFKDESGRIAKEIIDESIRLVRGCVREKRK